MSDEQLVSYGLPLLPQRHPTSSPMATPLQPSRTSSRNEHKPLNPRRQMSRPSYTSRSSPPPRGSRRAGLLETIKDAVRPSAWVAFVKGTAHGLGVRYRHASRKQKVSLGIPLTVDNERADFPNQTGIALVSPPTIPLSGTTVDHEPLAHSSL